MADAAESAGDFARNATTRLRGTAQTAMNRWDAARTSLNEQATAQRTRYESMAAEAQRRGGATLDAGTKHLDTIADMTGAAKKGGVKGLADKLAEKAGDAKKEGRETSWGDRAMQLSAVMGLTSDIGSLLEKNDQQPPPAAAPTIINMGGGGGGYSGDFTYAASHF